MKAWLIGFAASMTFGVIVGLISWGTLTACSTPTAQAAENFLVRVGEDTCQEEANQPAESELVRLVCDVGEAVVDNSGILSPIDAGAAPPKQVRISYPRAKWMAMRSSLAAHIECPPADDAAP
jgi:hypothetical protein